MLDIDAQASLLLTPFAGPVAARKLAEHHLGRGSVRYWKGCQTPAMLSERRPGIWRIYLRETGTARGRRWLVLHELAEWHLQRIDYRDGDTEEQADALAAALAAPRPWYLQSLMNHGENFEALAHDFAVTETCAALRLGETTEAPVAVVAPERVRLRGGPQWAWPSLKRIRKAARGAARGLRRHVLRDAGRVALVG